MPVVGRPSNKTDGPRFNWSTPMGELDQNSEGTDSGKKDVTNKINIHEVLNWAASKFPVPKIKRPEP